MREIKEECEEEKVGGKKAREKEKTGERERKPETGLLVGN